MLYQRLPIVKGTNRLTLAYLSLSVSFYTSVVQIVSLLPTGRSARVLAAALTLAYGGGMVGDLPALSQSEPPPSNLAPGQPAPTQPTLSPGQLSQLVAPIALYPDALVGQIMMAATYPLEVVEASRWLQDPANAGLRGDDLTNALTQQSWDPSVKSLVAYPEIIQMMDTKLDWTQSLGNAFLAQQGDVMASIQQLRQQAQQTGHLQTTPQQVVTVDQGDIAIEPANPQMVYVPDYDPAIVYGTWGYPSYPPVYFPPWPGYVLAGGIGFGVGFAISAPFWGWDRFDWRHHSIYIDRGRYDRLSPGHPYIGGATWQHDPYHRQGVPYRNPVVRAQFDAARLAAPRPAQNVRGYEGGRPGNQGGRPNEGGRPGGSAQPGFGHGAPAPAYEHGGAAPPQGHAAAAPPPQQAAHQAGPFPQNRQAAPQPAYHQANSPPPAPRAPSTAFEGVPRGNAVRADANRGYASHAAAQPQAAPRPAAPPAQRAAPPPAQHAAPPPAQHGNSGREEHR